MNRKVVTAGLATFCLALTACGGGDSEASSTDGNLTAGVIGLTSDASLEIAEDQDYFDEVGISGVDVTTVSDPPAAIAAVQSGDIDVAYTPSIPYFNALSQGIDLTVVAAADGFPKDAADVEPETIDDTGLYVQNGSDISSPADLEGKSVAVPARNAQLEITISEAIEQDGGDPELVQWMVLDFASALDSLGNGQVDAAGVVSPFTQQADDAGYTLLASPGMAFFEDGAIGLWVAGTDEVEQNPEKYEAFQEALSQAADYGNENTDEAREYASEITGIEVETLEQGATTYWPTDVRYDDLDRANTKMTDLGYLPNKAPFEPDNILGAE